MTNARNKANIPVLNFASKGIDDNADATAITIDSSEHTHFGLTSSPSAGQGGVSILNYGTIQSSRTATGNLSHSEFYNPNGQVGNIKTGGSDLNINASSSLTFYTNNAEKMRILADGKVGIGTSNPAYKLTVQASADNQDLIRLNHPSAATAGAMLGFTTDGTTANNVVTLGVQYSNADFDVINIQRSTQNVGIGTTSPAHNLEIVTTASGSVNDSLQIRNNSASSGTGSRIRFINSTDSASDANGASISCVRIGADNDLVFETENSEAMRIDHARNVGIGTASPGAKLEIQTSTDWGNIINSTNSGTQYLKQFEYNGSSIGKIRGDNSSIAIESGSNLIFQTANTERARFTTNTFMVGKTSANGATNGVELKTDDESRFTQTGRTVIAINRLSSDGNIVEFKKDNTGVGSISVRSSDLCIFSSASGHSGLRFGGNSIFATNNSGVENDNTVDFGSPNLKFKDIYLGGGAFIGGTGTANKLDDYEEGTWTPVYRGNSSAGSYSANASGHYTKVGNKVYVNCHLKNITQNSAGSSTIQISGLPFASSSSQESNIGSVYLNLFSFPTGDYVVATVNPGLSSVLFTSVSHDGSTETLSLSARNSDSADIFFSVTYLT
jgi:hypothetical protein